MCLLFFMRILTNLGDWGKTILKRHEWLASLLNLFHHRRIGYCKRQEGVFI